MALWRSTNDGRRSRRGGEETTMPIPEAVASGGATKQCNACLRIGTAHQGAQRHVEAADVVLPEVIDGIEVWLCAVPALCIATAKAKGIWCVA